MSRSMRWRLVPLVLALPMLGGAGVCGVVLVDIAQRELILEPLERLTFVVDSGSVEVYAFGRNGTSLFYYMVGSEYAIGDVGWELDGAVLDVVSFCDRPDPCTVSWTADVAFGTAVDVKTNNGGVKISGVDADVVADVAGGDFEAAILRAPSLDVTVESGDATIEMVELPSVVSIVVGEGNVELTLPPGTYRCELDARDGAFDTTTVACDPTGTALVQITVDAGDITLLPGTPP